MEIVKATHEHKPGVMIASEDVYAGLDYLPVLYEEWIKEGGVEKPRRFNFVVLLDSVVVGFFSLLFTEDKSKFLSSAQRVAKAYRNQGVGRKIGDFTTNFARSINSDVEQLISFTDVWMSDFSLQKKISNEGGSLVRLSAPLMNLKLDFVKNLEERKTKLRVADDKFLYNVLVDPWKQLLHSSFLHVNWDPYYPTAEADIDYILSKKPTVVCDSNSFSIFSNPIVIPEGKRIGLDIFADSEESFLDHVRFQLQNFAINREPDEIFKLFIFSPSEFTEALLKVLKLEMKIPTEDFITLGTVERPYPSMYICKKSMEKC